MLIIADSTNPEEPFLWSFQMHIWDTYVINVVKIFFITIRFNNSAIILKAGLNYFNYSLPMHDELMHDAYLCIENLDNTSLHSKANLWFLSLNSWMELYLKSIYWQLALHIKSTNNLDGISERNLKIQCLINFQAIFRNVHWEFDDFR